jgi:hypothetical protein
MSQITPQVRVGITSTGDANVEVWTPGFRQPDATMEEIHIPADALDGVAKFLLKNG